MPDFALELKLAGPNGGLICGVDEAGRGPLAGPVVAAAVILDRRKRQRMLWGGIDDSKKLTHDKREALFLRLRQHALAGEARIGIGAASVAEIAQLNIFHATMLAMCRAVTALRVVPMHALIDGNHCPKQLGCPATAVVDGDALSVSIAAASIVAKVVRDRAMAKLHQRLGQQQGLWHPRTPGRAQAGWNLQTPQTRFCACKESDDSRFSVNQLNTYRI